MGAVINGKPERPTLALLDDMVDQTLRALVLNLVCTSTRPADLSDGERQAILDPYDRMIDHHKRILCDVLRQAGALGETAVMEEFDKLGVERALLEVVVDRRRA